MSTLTIFEQLRHAGCSVAGALALQMVDVTVSQ